MSCRLTHRGDLWATLALLAGVACGGSRGAGPDGGTAVGGAATGGMATGGAATGGSRGSGGDATATGGTSTGGRGEATGGAPDAGSGGASTSSGGATTSSGGRSGSAGKGGASATGGVGGRGGAGGGPSTSGGASGAAGASGACVGAAYDAAHPPRAVPLTGTLGTHDPVMILSNGTFYEYATGLDAKTSTDMMKWSAAPNPLALPSWARTATGATNLWAPDVSFFGGVFHLYYAASTFGSNQSCIGQATRAALNSGAWADQGMVLCSNMGSSRDDWNAIDPNVILDEAGAPWLAFGSFWGGLKMVKLDPATGLRADTKLYALAARPNAGGALEAAFVFQRCGYFYLFMSWDKCCQGVDSTYNIRVGRATAVTGPYADKAGTALMQGGGTLLVQGDTRWKGPGHSAVLVSGNATYDVHHAYDAQNNGDSFLRISELVWDADGWPISGGP